MTKLERLFPTFGAAFAVIYAVVLDFNIAAVTYVPKLGEWHVGVFQPAPGDGPPMYWYGLVLTSLIVAIVVTAAAALIPSECCLENLAWPYLAAAGWINAVLGVAAIALLYQMTAASLPTPAAPNKDRQLKYYRRVRAKLNANACGDRGH